MLSKFLDVVDLFLLCYEKAEIWVSFAQFLEFRSNGGDIELFLKLSTAVLEGLVVQKYDVGLGKFFSGFFRYANIVIFMQRGSNQSNLVTIYNLHQLLTRTH